MDAFAGKEAVQAALAAIAGVLNRGEKFRGLGIEDMVTKIQQQIGAALFGNDIALLRELFEQHPLELRGRPASMTYLGHAANLGNVEAVKLLIELGADVNPDEKYRPLNYAMERASIELIELLLESGGDPNHGRCIIGALNRKTDKLAAVRLLVDHGVDVNRVFDLEGTNQKFTALDWSKDDEVVAYLRNVGAKTWKEVSGRDTQPRPGEFSDVTEYFRNTFGEVDRVSLNNILPTGNPVAVHVIRPSGDRKHLTLFTNGLSSGKMNVPSGLREYALAELFIQLPGDWEFDSPNPRLSWPVDWLRRISKHPHEKNVCLGGPVTIIANGDPPEPLGPETEFTSLLLVAENSFRRSDGNIVQLYRVAPIYSEERELEIREGAAALMRAFDRKNVPFVVDLRRPNVASSV